ILALGVLLLLSLVYQASAICVGGFNFGIGGEIAGQQGAPNRCKCWNVYDHGCNVIDGLTTNDNPCTQGIFGCSPAPIKFNQYINTDTGLRYACRPNSLSENCGGNSIDVCVSN
ncbi:hypothetical protein K435DRAFT_602521, partial [Dendrothele bispora CBS 962.96]